MKKVFVAGSSGATGRHLTDQLLSQGIKVRTVVRNPENLPGFLKNRDGLEVLKGSLLDQNDQQLAELVSGCDAIASCLGHNLNFKGIYGHPRRLCTEAVQRLCDAAIANKPAGKVKFVLMNTSGNRNKDLNEKVSFSHKMVIGLLRGILPPQPDNEQAAEHLRSSIGQHHDNIEWVVVRPDGLINEEKVSNYVNYPSPTRDPIFDAGKTSRINVAHFMSQLISNKELWEKWKGQMPMIYNKGFD